jgi:hypothetical protein
LISHARCSDSLYPTVNDDFGLMSFKEMNSQPQNSQLRPLLAAGER